MTQLAEMFYSLRGEGYHAGSPALFLRFPACNLACPGCDTHFNRHFAIEREEILRYAERVSARAIVFTGGEPMHRIHEINKMITAWHARDFEYQIETNGTVSCEGLDPRVWISCSPKVGVPLGVAAQAWHPGNVAHHSGLRMELHNLAADTLAGADELKYIVDREFEHPQVIDEYVMRTRGSIEAPHRYLQPWAGKSYQENLEVAMKLVYSRPNAWKLGLQLHKILGVQ